VASQNSFVNQLTTDVVFLRQTMVSILVIYIHVKDSLSGGNQDVNCI
jgi:hypothetical protein